MEDMGNLISHLKKIILLIICTSSIGFAQLDNHLFNYKYEIDSSYTSKLFLSINHMSFMKDNEYFNKLVDGYTLFGYQFNPSITYFPHQNIRLDAGIFLWKDFGNNQYSGIFPTFTFTYSKNGFRFLFGNIESGLSHRLIEPLFDFERVMTNRLENGAQFIFDKKYFYIDAWVDWQKMIYKGSAYKEEISAGLSSYLKINSDKKIAFTIPIQWTIKHKGGQIETTGLPLTNWINGCIGLENSILFTNPFIGKFRFQGYLTWFNDNSPEQILPFKNGMGYYLNLSTQNTLFYLMVSYWNGNNFFSPQGGEIYQSVSTNYFNPTYTELNRQILIIRLMKDFTITDHISITARIEPFVNLTNKHWDYAIGVYINYQDFFLLKKFN